MDELTSLKNAIRTGWVSSVNILNSTARVTFKDKGDAFVSAPLKIVKNQLTPWLPFIGQYVLCIFLPNGDGDGFILGGI